MPSKYYQKKKKKKKKERLRKEARERYQNLSEEKKTKSVNIIVNNIEIFLNIKNKD